MKKISKVGRKRDTLGAIFAVRLKMKYDLDADNPESYNLHLKKLRELVNAMEEA